MNGSSSGNWTKARWTGLKIKAQFGMVMNLDKCIGCHTCSVTCNNTWTNRPGAEYMWWNNVETKPGIGYPKEWEQQETNKGGWELKNGKLELKAGGKTSKLLNLFYNPIWRKSTNITSLGRMIMTVSSTAGKAPSAGGRPVSLLTGNIWTNRMGTQLGR